MIVLSLFQRSGVGKDDVSELLPVEQAVRAEHVAEGVRDRAAQRRVASQLFVIDGVAVEHARTELFQRAQGTRLARAGRAGDAEEQGRRVRDVKARGLFQPVRDGKAEPAVVRLCAQISVTLVPSKVRRASKTCCACASLSSAGRAGG